VLSLERRGGRQGTFSQFDQNYPSQEYSEKWGGMDDSLCEERVNEASPSNTTSENQKLRTDMTWDKAT
jgi:hypothetical protein